MDIHGANGDNLDCLVRWSSDWPDSEGHWWLHRADRKEHRRTTLVYVARCGDGNLMVCNEAEIFYRQQQTEAWSFAKAVLPCPPNARSHFPSESEVK